MSKAFAQKVIESMVDENGHCGERGLSERQFDIIVDAMTDFEEGEEQDLGEWEGDYKTVWFWGIDYTGNVGPYRVVLNKHYRFHFGYNVVSIELRPIEEYEAELEAERKRKAMMDFSDSQWVGQPKKRQDFELMLVNDYVYEGYTYSYYDSGESHIYTFRDGDGNCVVWKTKSPIGYYDTDGEWHDAEIGSTVTMKATVKEHGEYRGNKQTIINRPKISGIK